MAAHLAVRPAFWSSVVAATALAAAATAVAMRVLRRRRAVRLLPEVDVQAYNDFPVTP